jgi:hypothetical protein
MIDEAAGDDCASRRLYLCEREKRRAERSEEYRARTVCKLNRK